MTWWHRLWHRSRMEAQLEKELHFHLEQHVADLIAQGRSPQDARRQARIALGGPDQIKEQCRDARGTRWLEDLFQDVRYALRTFRQKPGFSLVALLTLALGIGATAVMFTMIYGVLLKPLTFPESDHLVTIHQQFEKFGDTWGFSYPNFLDVQAAVGSLQPAAWTYGGATISEPGEPEYVAGRRISADLFSVLGLPMLQGRAFLSEEDQRGASPVAIISDSLWAPLRRKPVSDRLAAGL